MELVVRVVERKTGTASTRRLRRDLFGRSEYRSFVKVHGDLKSLAGTPPFDVSLGKKHERALSFEDLRRKVLDVARDGVPLQRFKGLGEMNADQLFHDGSREADPAAGDDRRRQRRRPDLFDADGRCGRAAPHLHRSQCP
jgi:hypothetical protein